MNPVTSRRVYLNKLKTANPEDNIHASSNMELSNERGVTSELLSPRVPREKETPLQKAPGVINILPIITQQ